MPRSQVLRRFLTATVFAVFAAFVMIAASPAYAVNVQVVTGKSGVKAWLVQDHLNPIISVRFAWRGGAALDPKGKAGLANMVSGLLDEGAADLDSEAYQKALDANSISLSFDANKDSFSGQLTMLTDKAGTGWSLLEKALTRPHFDAGPVARIRSQILAGLRQSAEDPDSIAGRTLMKTLFPGHPYARPTDGTPESVKAITADDLHGFVRDRLARDNLVIGVVGDIRPDELAGAIDQVFGTLPKAAKGGTVADIAPPARGSREVVRKKVPQSSILWAQPGPARHDKDFYALYVMNYVLGGGGLNSRLSHEIREKRGLAYSVYSYLAPYDHTAIIAGGGATRNDKVAEALKVMRDEWAKMADKGITKQELQDAKTYLTGSYPLRFTSSGNIADMMVGLQIQHFGPDYFDKRNGLVDAVTLRQVNAAAKKWLKPDSLTVVVVGDPKGVESSN